MATQSQLELQASIRMNAMANVDVLRDIENWEKQMKSEENRNKIQDNSEPPKTIEQNRSEIYKTEGNKCYGAGDFKRAITFYSKAISADRNGKLSGVLYSNRAMCQFKLGNLEECVIDCNESLGITPNNEKSIFRRMEANYQLKNVQMAEKDCKHLLAINPKHTAALDFQFKLKVELENNTRNTLQDGPSYTSTIDGIGAELQFVKIPTHKQPNATLKRIRITTKCSDANTSSNDDQSIVTDESTKEISTNFANKENSIKSSPKWSTIDSMGIDLSFIEKSINEKYSELKAISINGSALLTDAKLTKNQENHALKSDGPAIPLSAATFFKTWKNFKETNERFVWLKTIPSAGFVDLLGSHLDSVLLSEMLAVFSEYFVPNRIPVMPYLREIAKSDQLCILSMMMSKEDKEALSILFEFTKKLNETELAFVTKRFSI